MMIRCFKLTFDNILLFFSLINTIVVEYTINETYIIGLRFLEISYDSTSQNGDFTDYETPRFSVYLFVAMGVEYSRDLCGNSGRISKVHIPLNLKSDTC